MRFPSVPGGVGADRAATGRAGRWSAVSAAAGEADTAGGGAGTTVRPSMHVVCLSVQPMKVTSG
jgi:hypothetical protein